MKRILILFFAFVLIFLGYGLTNIPKKQVKTEGRETYYTLKDATGDILSANITIIKQVVDKETGEETDIAGPSYDFSQDDLKKLNDALSVKDGVQDRKYIVKFCGDFHADYKLKTETSRGALDIEICYTCSDIILRSSVADEKTKRSFQEASMSKAQADAFRNVIAKFDKSVFEK